jgi:hypothetical protein
MDAAALDELLNSPAGPVGVLLTELSLQATALAKAKAPVIVSPTNFSSWGRVFRPDRFQYYETVGGTKAHVHWSGFLFNSRGQMYSGVNAPYGPTLFLQYGGGRHRHAELNLFMSTALDEVQL